MNVSLNWRVEGDEKARGGDRVGDEEVKDERKWKKG